MSKLSVKQLWKDTKILREEYEKEDKRIYKNLFGDYFGDIEHYWLCSKTLPKLSWCVHDIYIYIDRYPEHVETFLVSTFEMQFYTEELKKDPIIRTFTKLCFYIEEKIKPYTSIDKDKGPHCVEQ